MQIVHVNLLASRKYCENGFRAWCGTGRGWERMVGMEIKEMGGGVVCADVDV